MRAAPREQEELPIVSPLEIESRRRRISKTPSPNILLQVEEEVPAKIARIEMLVLINNVNFHSFNFFIYFTESQCQKYKNIDAGIMLLQFFSKIERP